MFARLSTFIAFVVFSETLVLCDKYANKFNNIYGCKQANAVVNYNHPTDFIPTENFENIGAGINSTFIRLGILGKSDAIIRLSKKAMPYNKDTLHEIVLGMSSNRFTEVRRQIRNNAHHHQNHVLIKVPTPNVLSELEPFVMTIEFERSGTVRLTRDGETAPFLEFSDPKAEISYNYLGFSNWLSKMIYFFDCPVYNFDLRFDNMVLEKS
ncbi:uncharacterized protein LOC131687456 [Topomyia yanbarensis]|uniref:uncharacterized protein LOC131687456 n=1 Tax=Topomyia yanbarensis TaxID=2498891 RepID=UPI00273B062A|nr:uncharacterized protein LOC131687456 [Topomyia yanbarensis]